MFPFADYYAENGIYLNKTGLIDKYPIRYRIEEEIFAIIIIVLLLGIEFFISIVQLSMFKPNPKKNSEFLRLIYKEINKSPSKINRKSRSSISNDDDEEENSYFRSTSTSDSRE